MSVPFTQEMLKGKLSPTLKDFQFQIEILTPTLYQLTVLVKDKEITAFDKLRISSNVISVAPKGVSIKLAFEKVTLN